ncbi:MAG: ABC transporter permease, partial [Magnetococcales bacterium]|nr:ABC transporter permease [Magnetococcales bacterium]
MDPGGWLTPFITTDHSDPPMTALPETQKSQKNTSRNDAADHVVIIRPGKNFRLLNLKELWNYRELLWVLAMRDVKVRYKQTVLGAAWAILQPVLAMVIFTVFFGRLAKMPSEGYPYPLFVYTALLPWTFFATAVANSGNSMIASANLVSKVYFPRLIIPLSAIGAGLMDFAIASTILLAMMIVYQVGWTLNLLLVPFLTVAVVFCALGVGILLAALNVAYRDFRYVIPFLVQIWMFATPVVYPVSLVPESWRWMLFLNPMAGLIDGFRSAFLGKPFDASSLGISMGVALGIFLLGVA